MKKTRNKCEGVHKNRQQTYTKQHKKKWKKNKESNSFTCTLRKTKNKEHLLLSNEMCVTFTAAILTSCARPFPNFFTVRSMLTFPAKIDKEIKQKNSQNLTASHTRSSENKSAKKWRTRQCRTKRDNIEEKFSSYFTWFYFVLCLFHERFMWIITLFASLCH